MGMKGMWDFSGSDIRNLTYDYLPKKKKKIKR